MDLNTLKRQLINQILRSDDPELLQTVQQMLRLGAPSPSDALPFDQEPGATDADTQDLQREIDDLFNHR